MSAGRAGRVEEITAHSNPRIKAIRALSQKKHRDREGLFVAEGLKHANDALAAGWTIATLVHSKAALADEKLRGKVEQVSATIRARGGDVLIVPDRLLSAISRRDNPLAVLSVIESRTADLSELPADNAVWLALDRVRDPGNLGTCFRTAEALGIAAIVLVGDTTDPFALETVRATMGAFFHIPFARMNEAEFAELASRWQEKGGHVTGTHLAGSSDFRALDYSEGPQLVVMGNEQAGLSPQMADACDRLARIPMSGEADSMNLAVATGIMLFETRRHAL